MDKSGDVVEHPVTGERITFLETSGGTGGEYATFELRVRPHGFVAAPHVHPIAEESFEIRSGTFTFVVNGEERQVRAGEGATVPPAPRTRGGTLAKRRAWLLSSFVRP